MFVFVEQMCDVCMTTIMKATHNASKQNTGHVYGITFTQVDVLLSILPEIFLLLVPVSLHVLSLHSFKIAHYI